MTPLRASDHRLSVDDWINAGFAILSDAGPNTLRIDRLCDRLGVTKGSFYWHFADMSAYHTALVDAWASLRDQDRRRFEAIYDLDPRERLCVMMASLVSPRYWELERVMRVWALTDEAVEASVRASDRRVLRAVRQALLDYGFKPDDANLRALMMFTAGIGFLHSANAAQDAPPELRERFMDFMLRP